MSPHERAAEAAAAGYVTRPMKVDDADRIAAVHVAVWQAAYDGIMDAEFLQGLDPVRFATNWRRTLAENDSGPRFVGQSSSGEVVGFGIAGPARDDAPACDWELYAINVLPEAQGTALAHLLMADLVGDRDSSLWVAEGNDQAIAFYRGYGFTPDGATQRNDRAGATEIRMVRIRS